MSRVAFRWPILIMGLALSGHAECQPITSLSSRDAANGTDELKGGRWFQLTLPAIGLPLHTSWAAMPAPTFEFDPPPFYRWEVGSSLRGPVSLRGFNAIQPAIDLSCIGLHCETKAERVLGLEGRMNLGGVGKALPNNYLFMKQELILDAVRNFKRIRIGIGGDLDL